MSICYNCFNEIGGNIRCPYCGYDAAEDRSKYPLALPHGSVLGGRYITGRVLGQGGFGITYVAEDYSDKKLVAIKEYFPDTLALRQQGTRVSTISGEREENFRYGKECFLSEAKTLAAFIGNPHIVRVYSYFEENGTAYFAMEYIHGVSLMNYLKSHGGQISYEEARDILLPVMDALNAVHAKGVVHRDISPDNIYITNDHVVKLIDFGAARYSMGDRSRSLDVVLKHGYAPKEQYTRRGRQGPFTDVYALAATFYRSITGRIPPDSVERMDEDELAAPSALGCVLPIYAEDALLKALSVSASDRFQSMDEFKAALLNTPVSAAPATQRTPFTPSAVPEIQFFGTENRAQAFAQPSPAAPVQNPAWTPAQSPATEWNPPQAPAQSPATEWNPPQAPAQSPATEWNPPQEPDLVFPVQEPSEKPKKKSNKLKAIIAAVVVLAVAAGAALFFIIPSLPSVKYDKAVSALESGDYREAEKLFTELGDYEDSPAKLNQAMIGVADLMIDEHDYEGARTHIANLTHYSAAQEVYNRSYYEEGKDMMSRGQYSSAITAFENIRSYKDTSTLIKQAYYERGKQNLSSSNYMAAINDFEKSAGYSDSDTQMKEAKYQFAKNADISSRTAYDYLKELKDAGYRDSATIFKERYPWKVKTLSANNSKSDDTTIKASAAKECSYFHAEFEIIGGVPDEKVTLYAKITWPNGYVENATWSWEDYELGDTCGIEWPNGFTFTSGTLTIAVCMRSNDQELGRVSIKLS